MAQELKVIQDFYDFMLPVIQHTEKFPRHHRYSLGLAIENRLQAILDRLLRAKYARSTRRYLFTRHSASLPQHLIRMYSVPLAHCMAH